ncbi:MAG: beta-ketoacyl-ACP synthase III [Verrucomicrobia bacterium]|nr:beta-ketoacyl-ACP synthase III [Cytophagales bacterium]
MLPVKILALGKYLPANEVSSATLANQLGIEESWILTNSGVSKRHWVNQESGAEMGAKALEKALKKANMDFLELDLIICASASYDYPIPSTACLIPVHFNQLQAGIPCWDLDATCLSFITALDTVSYLIAGGKYKKVAIISSEIASKSLHIQDKETYTLFGDGAAAAIICRAEDNENASVLCAGMQTFSEGALDTLLKAGGNKLSGRDRQIPDVDFTFQMKGRKLLRTANEKLLPFFEKLLQEAGLVKNDLDLLIPHQASKLGLLLGQKLLGLPDEKFYKNLETHGNCIAASIPMALHDAIEAQKISRGDKVCLLGTGAGFSVGGIIFTF